ncbi:MAG: DNA cytosine methyltransferase [Okeania sp. SIO3I5]|nr:DNA cytosine methyltransferase [Okeania sp. SIO3I5]
MAKKQFGNAVYIPVVYYLAKSLVRSLGFLH